MAQDLDMLEAVVWEWFTDHGRWRPYQAHIVRGIEENYGKTVMLRLGDIEPSMGMYEIDFSTQQQIRNNTGEFFFSRLFCFPSHRVCMCAMLIS